MSDVPIQHIRFRLHGQAARINWHQKPIFTASGDGVEFTAFRPTDMPMETGVRFMQWGIRLQAGGGFHPVVDVVARFGAAPLEKVIGITANIIFAGIGERGSGDGFMFHIYSSD